MMLHANRPDLPGPHILTSPSAAAQARMLEVGSLTASIDESKVDLMMGALVIFAALALGFAACPSAIVLQPVRPEIRR
jgi:hypothetical protein